MYNAYIQNYSDGIVSVIDTGTNTVSATVTVGTHPYGAAITPDNKYAYVTNEGSGTVSVINTATNTVSATVTVGNTPGGVATTPDGSKAYVANWGSGTVSVIGTATNTVSATVTVGTNPYGVAITPDGSKAYVANEGSGTVSVINTANNTVSATVTVGTNPYGVAITPDGTKAYVANESGGSAGTVSVINTANNTVSATVTVGNGPIGVAITPDGSKAYVANYTSGTVSVINTTNNTVSTTITVGTEPTGVAITPDGSKAYVPNFGSGTVSVIDTGTNTVSTTVTVGTNPCALGIFIQQASIPMTTVYTAPQGRLTLTSATPVMTADATAQTSVYYTPYQGNIVPIYDGANMQSYTFAQLTMSLNTSNQTSGNIYDLFIFLNSSVVTIGAGPAWSSGTSRGTGAGTTELQQIDGLWVNKNTITLKNGSTSYSSIPAGEATYVGSVYMTANGQTGMQFKPAAASGGSNNILGVYNAYNHIRTTSFCQDSTSSWTYGTATWRSANNSNSNRIRFVDGLQQSFLESSYQVGLAVASTNTGVGVNLDSTSATPSSFTPIDGTLSNNIPALSENIFYPQLGFHYVQAVENALGGTGNATFNAAGEYQYLKLALEM